MYVPTWQCWHLPVNQATSVCWCRWCQWVFTHTHTQNTHVWADMPEHAAPGMTPLQGPTQHVVLFTCKHTMIRVVEFWDNLLQKRWTLIQNIKISYRNFEHSWLSINIGIRCMKQVLSFEKSVAHHCRFDCNLFALIFGNSLSSFWH